MVSREGVATVRLVFFFFFGAAAGSACRVYGHFWNIELRAAPEYFAVAIPETLRDPTERDPAISDRVADFNDRCYCCRHPAERVSCFFSPVFVRNMFRDFCLGICPGLFFQLNL